jgi:hypothetical protein
VKNPSSRSVLLLALLARFSAAAVGADQDADYGTVVGFTKNRTLVFRDFTMRFLGRRHVGHPVFKHGFTYCDFEVRSSKVTQTISWSSGTGVIDSASFEVDGRPYELELRGSVARKGWLREDEMVVWPEAKYLKALAARKKESR